MKSFWVTVLLLCLLLIAVGADAVQCRMIRDELSDRISALPSLPNDQALAAAKRLDAAWQSHLPRLRLTVPKQSIDEIDREIAALLAAAASADVSGYRAAKEILKRVID